MIQCRNCGAEFDEQERCCPYCGTDNFNVSLKEHREKVNDYRKKTRFWRILPDRLAKRGMKIVTVALIGIVVLGMVGAGIAMITGKRKAHTEYVQKTQALAELEIMYEQQDYDAIAKKVKEKIFYGSAFDKYYHIYRLDMLIGFFAEDYEQNLAYSLQYDRAMYLDGAVYLFEAMALCEEWQNEDIIELEKESLDYYHEQILYYLSEILSLSEADITKLYDMYQKNEEEQRKSGNYDDTGREAIEQYIFDVYKKNHQ